MNSIDYRYQVGTGRGDKDAYDACYGEYRRKEEAEAALVKLRGIAPAESVWLYDRHARHGQVEEWLFSPGQTIPQCVVRGR